MGFWLNHSPLYLKMDSSVGMQKAKTDFESLKQAMTSTRTLALPKFDESIVI